jgi:F-type H+-transporting ATPase subunit a
VKEKDRRFCIIDGLLLAGAVLPVLAGVVLRILTKPLEEGITVSGAGVFFEIPLPLQPLPVTEAQVNSVIVIVTLFFLCRYLTHGIRKGIITRRQVFAEWAVEQCEKLVDTNMGEFFKGFAPFIAAILGLSAFSSLLTLLGMFPPTSDINVTAGWAILVFILITYYKMKGGFGHYLKSFAEPVAFLTPLNIIGEIATPISMAFRHYGNVLSGSVIGVLIAAALQGLSSIVLGWLPGFLGDIPFLQVGLPAILSIYFDIFSGALQAFIFAMLTMLYIAGAFSPEAFRARQEKKAKRKNKTEV